MRLADIVSLALGPPQRELTPFDFAQGVVSVSRTTLMARALRPFALARFAMAAGAAARFVVLTH